MSSFSQWRAAFEKDSKVKQLTWVCGSERILVEEIVTSIRESLSLSPWNVTSLVAGEISERDIWNEIRQVPMGLNAIKLTVVRSAERLKNFTQFDLTVRDRLTRANSYVVFVSNEEGLARITPEGEKFAWGKGELVPHLAGLKNKGALVECRPFTVATAKHAVTWVQHKANIRPAIAAHLLNRADGNLRVVRDVCNKLSLFPGEVTMTVINEMLAQRPRDSFVDALLALDKKTALMALNELPKSDWSRTLGLLDSRLELAGLIHDMQVEHKTGAEIAKAAGGQNFLVKDILGVAKHYDRKRRLKIREILALVDEHSSFGYPEGSLHAVVAFW